MKDQTTNEGRVLQTFANEAFQADVVEEPGIDCPVVVVHFIVNETGKPASITFCSCHVRQFRKLLSEVVEYLDQLDQG